MLHINFLYCYYANMYKLPQNDESIIFFEDYQKADMYIPFVVAVLNKCNKGTLYFGVKSNGDVVGAKCSESTIYILHEYQQFCMDS